MDENDVSVSVIVPAFNVERYILNCLDSLLNQTVQDIEIIVVNDGSTDRTQQVVEEYIKDYDKIRLINKANGGVSSARICGIKAAKGKYIGFVDGDDLADPELFECLFFNAVKYNTDISHCGYVMEFPSGKKVFYYNTGEIIIQDHITGLKDLVSGKLIEPSLCNKIYKRTLFDSFLDSFDLSIKNTEDLYMNYLLFEQAKISVFEDRCLYRYILRENSATSSGKRFSILSDSLNVLKKLYDRAFDLPSVQKCIEKRMLDIMVNLATQNTSMHKDKVFEVQKELKRRLPGIIRSGDYSMRTKAKVIAVSISPKLYKDIHRKYQKITGKNKKYSLEK